MNYLRSNSSADSLLRQDSEELEQLLANDTHSLERMGYSQELYRGFNSFMAIAFSFTSVAAVSSITSLFPIALSTGGPAVMVWSWVGASTFTILSGLSMAEISSAYPSAGSVYYWAGKMSPPEWAPVVSYVTGWFNLLGNGTYR